MQVYITGATGFIGRRLTAALLDRGHSVRVLVRPGSEQKAPSGAEVCIGDALYSGSFEETVQPAGTLIHLIGVPHPSPSKAEAFRQIDLPSIRASVEAARHARVGHLIYVSVAQPAPVMRAYIAVRQDGEAVIRRSGLHATILRPWYVLGPGRRWPVVLTPLYWLLRRIPRTRDAAQRLGLVTVDQMVAAMMAAVEDPPRGVRVVEAPQIRSASLRPREEDALLNSVGEARER